ncbi:hypothetical protein HK100_010936 [Physocladia obscura]|uniref:Dynein regulatory complex protein 1 n=1 Tax=Physocladia obscura TaxID=109957 RepID=A0AAD5T1X9_9FUNG|nr:hypothetical protein HK100_010936 [Physocladia obscura]
MLAPPQQQQEEIAAGQQPISSSSQQQQHQQFQTGGGGGNPGGGAGSNTKEARIHARKIRIEAARMAKMKPDKSDDSDGRRKPKLDGTEKKEAGKARAQMSASNKKIDSIKLSTTELVTNIRVGIVARESQRRLDDFKKTQHWEKKRTDDSIKSMDMHDTISVQWANILAINNKPYELNELLQKQRDACDTLMASKSRLLNEYMVDLKAKDDDYVKELKRQAEEIDMLIERMEEQYRNLQTSLKEELELIEKSFIEERSELIETNMKEIETLFSQRRENEAKYLEERSERIDDHVKQLEALRVRDAEEYNLVKIKLETDVQVLEQQLQQMRATYQLNTEKLEYNFQVLKKREEENASILGTQKRKITRLTDHLNSLKAKMSKQEKMYQQEYVSLTDDYKRILEQYKELQKKYRHFQISDTTKYTEIWAMNEENTLQLMRKVIVADRIIVEQQLGMQWIAPPEDLFRTRAPNTFKLQKNGSQIHDENIDGVEFVGTKLHERTGGSNESLAAIFKETRLANAPAGYTKTMKKMLELLCNEAGFLVEEKLQKLLAPLHKDEQSLMKLDSIFKALGVETIEDIEKLTSFFFAKAQTVSDANASTTTATSADSVAAPNESIITSSLSTLHSSLINPNDVIRAIRKFVEDHRSEKDSGRYNFLDADEGSDEKNFVKSENEVMETNGINCKISPTSKIDQQRHYWERMAGVIDDKSYRIWMAVYVAMKKYNTLLTERHQLTQDIDSVRSQSEELKGLLRQYMAAKVNDELQVPPTQIMWHAAGGE